MRVRFLDTESTDLEGNFGRLLCYSYVDLDDEQVVTTRRDKKPWKGSKITDDSLVAESCKQDMEDADILVTWNGILHDVPLVNARLSAADLDPVRLGEKFGTWHLDLMYYAGGQSMKIGGRSLDRVAKFFHLPSQKTPLLPEVWADAGAGIKEAMDSVVEHCEFDVKVLKEVWPHLACYVKKIQFNLSEVWDVISMVPSRRAA
jgi:uncharacterized protein YprB with RNaseH-like and TPR domain